MNYPIKATLRMLGVFCLIATQSRAQQSEQAKVYSLKQAVEYALDNSVTVRNASIDTKIAQKRVNEIRSLGLPQISASVDYMHNFKPQQSILENSKSVPFIYNPNLPEGQVLNFSFLLANSATSSITANQLIFDGSYLLGLKAATTYTELSRKSLIQSKIETAEAVTKAYYSVLVNQERMGLLDNNISRLDSLLKDTRAMLKNGFVEKIDVDRLEVSLNNLRVEKQKTERLIELSRTLLKFQMGMDVNEQIVLSDKLAEVPTESLLKPSGEFNYANRIEYSILQTQKALNALEIRNIRAGYYPRLVAFGTYGANTAASKLSNIPQFSDRWFSYSFIGLNLHVPIFDSFQKLYKIQQAKLTRQKVENGVKQLENSINLQLKQAQISLTNSTETLKTQRRNLDLAQEVVRVTKIKYQQGVGSNIEVINAESALKEAQVNYYNALYDVLISKVDLDKYSGNLMVE